MNRNTILRVLEQGHITLTFINDDERMLMQKLTSQGLVQLKDNQFFITDAGKQELKRLEQQTLKR